MMIYMLYLKFLVIRKKNYPISILAAALTAMSTTSCLGHGPIYM